jgi:hypothetical protein
VIIVSAIITTIPLAESAIVTLLELRQGHKVGSGRMVANSSPTWPVAAGRPGKASERVGDGWPVIRPQPASRMSEAHLPRRKRCLANLLISYPNARKGLVAKSAPGSEITRTSSSTERRSIPGVLGCGGNSWKLPSGS